MTCNKDAFDAGKCPLCGQRNECQLCSEAAWKGPCWCAKVEIPGELLAQVPPELQNKSCICHKCIMTFRSQKYKTAGTPAVLPGDFYFDTDGLMVFTAAYLLRRGYCCDSGCRHCPYAKIKQA